MAPNAMNTLYGTHTQQRGPAGRHVRLSSELDLDSAGGSSNSGSVPSGGHYTPLTTPIVIETSNLMTSGGNNGPNMPGSDHVGPICASSPKRTMSAFTTFGPTSRSNVSTPMSPPPPMPPMNQGSSGPTTGHLV